MSDVKIQPMKNGPLMVKGEFELLDSAGQSMGKHPQMALCRCGHSSKKPMCDGSHRAQNFQSDVQK